MTAEEFFNKWNLENYFQSDNEYQRLALMKDFAKYHVEQTLIYLKEGLIDDGYMKEDEYLYYPLENIK